ncbi:MAG: thioredoxin fold domain-containing protein [Balneolales bacterium]|nr:thioredoxin fold domain-containing protein [Balneolales bacterium]
MKATLTFILLFVFLACGNQNSERSNTPPVQSRAVEQLSAREAQLLGLDKVTVGDESSWAGPTLYNMDEAQRLAAENGKKILMDVYTVWCGYCRKMAAETYPNNAVRQEVEKYFYTVRLDAESDHIIVFNGESMSMMDLATQLGVSSFPTTIFIDTNGEPIGIQPGFMDAQMFSSLLGFVGSDAYKTQSFEAFVRGRN